MSININKLYAELAAANLPVCSTRQGDPPADYTRPLTTAEKANADQIILAHDPTVIPVLTVEQKVDNLLSILEKKTLITPADLVEITTPVEIATP